MAGFMLKQCPYSCSVCNEKEHGSKICADRDHDQVYLLYHDQGVGHIWGRTTASYCYMDMNMALLTSATYLPTYYSRPVPDLGRARVWQQPGRRDAALPQDVRPVHAHLRGQAHGLPGLGRGQGGQGLRGGLGNLLLPEPLTLMYHQPLLPLTSAFLNLCVLLTLTSSYSNLNLCLP